MTVRTPEMVASDFRRIGCLLSLPDPIRGSLSGAGA
jgi:hypothetical protein